MTTTVTKVKGGAVQLPKVIQKAWQDADVILMPSEDSLYIKRITKPSLSDLLPKLKSAGKRVAQREMNDAVRWARKKVYEGRA